MTATEGILATSRDSNSLPHIHVVEITSGQDVDNTLPPIIVLHGMFGCSKNVMGFAETLSRSLERPRRIFVKDLRNHGKSGWHENMTYEALSADVENVMSNKGISQAVLVGHSIGGKIASYLALTRPNLVAGLVALDIAPAPYCPQADPDWGAVREALLALARLPLAGVTTRGEADRQLAPVVPDEALRAFCLTQLQPCPRTRRLRWKLNIQALAAHVDHLGEFQVDGQCFSSSSIVAESAYTEQAAVLYPTQFPRKALFLAGGGSRFLRSAHLGAIGARFPDYHLATVRGAGHWLHVEAPEKVASMINSYLAAL
eukprot:CAMPEP_0206404060 /NCGR_PEP_ID=MMETSP0294-20121207/28117_1 /ASSEMBLY_ACC=CAM_ASM_000327 /TAXON_ID=39354 /ORGANISM="Heterosigma akashiwo, Strain CCMP2393" /LENGTH=314 /DNA_ID=CAMNT_0053861833 /DNA_START=253 /DNA_END=1197 /DNA_ORIENTATION=-